jgi:hypothetical protein
LNAERCPRSSRGAKPTAPGELLPLGRSKEVKDGSVLALEPQLQMHIGRRGRPRIQVGHRAAARARDETTFADFDLADDRDATNTIFKHTRGVGDKAGARQLEHIAQEAASVDKPLSHPCERRSDSESRINRSRDITLLRCRIGDAAAISAKAPTPLTASDPNTVVRVELTQPMRRIGPKLHVPLFSKD